MFKLINRKMEGQNMDSDSKDMSLDLKLMVVYHIVMMILFALRPISNPINQLYLAILLLVMLVIISLFHKLKNNWSWSGLSFSGIPSLIFNLIYTYTFLAFVSYAMTSDGNHPDIALANIEALVIESWYVMLQAASNPVFTPWFLAGVGICFMKSMVSLKFMTLKKSEFEAQCRNS